LGILRQREPGIDGSFMVMTAGWRGIAPWAMRFLCWAMLALAPGGARADVDRVEVLARGVVADGKAFGNVGPYEWLRGKLYFAIEATAAENQAVVDIRATARDGQGRVHFTADFVLLRPLDAARGNGRLLYEVPNRGNVGLLGLFNNGTQGNIPAGAEQAGNGFLMEQGYALLWTGWSWDVPPGNDRLRADLPVATDGGKPLQGLVSGEITVNQATASAMHTGLAAIGYEPARIDDPEARLTVRDGAFGTRTPIPRERWHFGRRVDGRLVYDPAFVTLDGGFKPGQIYTVTFTARGPRVAGLGLAGIRDALLFFRHERTDRLGNPNPLVDMGGELPRAVLAFGHSQSARVLTTMIAQGLIADGRGRLAFDGAFLNAAGAGKGSFNYRFAQATRHFSPDVELDYPTDWFPFTTAPETDPVTGASGSILDKANPGNAVPKLIVANSATEYWARGASLIHVAVDGSADIAPDRRARLYFLAGANHVPATGGERGDLAHCRNPLDQRPVLRALLLHLDGWVTLKKEPPPSMLPLVADGTLGKLSAYTEAMPKIPGLRLPARMLDPPRLDFGPQFAADGIATLVPPKVGKAFTALVPLPDADGLDKAGIRMPELVAPLGTYTGWNPQNAATGAPERLARWSGSFAPFARNENERLAVGDPRPSIAERYSSREAYIEAYAAATLALAKQELIAGSDINPMVERAGALYDRIMAHDPASETCGF
jgi:hypothetical protein